MDKLRYSRLLQCYYIHHLCLSGYKCEIPVLICWQFAISLIRCSLLIFMLLI